MQYESGFSLKSWASDLGLRVWAFAISLDGYNLKLKITDIPSREAVEAAHRDLAEIAQIPKLKGYAGETLSVLEDFHLALIVPCLVQRHHLLDRLSRLRYADGYFARATCSSLSEVKKLYASISRVDNAKAHLFMAAFRLDCAIWHASNNYVTNRAADVRRNLKAFFEHVELGRATLPEFDAGLGEF